VVLLAWCGLFLVVASSTAPGLPPPEHFAGARDETAERVGRLIATLGSPSFAERERASRMLEAIGVPALPALRAATQHADLEIRRRAGALVDRVENSLEALALEYRKHGLPLPPDAPLVLYSYRGGNDRPRLGFLLHPPAGRAQPVVLDVFHLFRPPGKVEITLLEPAALSRKGAAALVSRADLWSNNALALAMQCQARGWVVLAHACFDRFLTLAKEGSPRQVLLQAAWEYWWDALSEPAADWRMIAGRLRALRAADRILDTEENRRFLKSLEAALVPSKARPGTIEAMIDGLMQERNRHYGNLGEDVVPEQPSDRLVGCGFAAVPHLMDHLEDDRLTRYLWVQGGISVSGPPRSTTGWGTWRGRSSGACPPTRYAGCAAGKRLRTGWPRPGRSGRKNTG
jgi:hypothetical protein